MDSAEEVPVEGDEDTEQGQPESTDPYRVAPTQAMSHYNPSDDVVLRLEYIKDSEFKARL
jgi:hypothetical protein